MIGHPTILTIVSTKIFYCPKCGKKTLQYENDRSKYHFNMYYCDCGFSQAARIPDCNICMVGQQHLKNLELRKQKLISFTEHKTLTQSVGTNCYTCKYNGVRGAKAWAMRQLNKINTDDNVKVPIFQGYDWFVEIEHD
jgi:predicted RNA-binding Zn-ribbon protein involved in translation (DUF1610 family)